MIEATGWTPPTINRVLAGAIARPLNWNLVVSNVPGPQLPFYLLGRQIEAIYPFVPLSPQGHALAIGIVSYNGGVFFGISGDRDVMADIDSLAVDVVARRRRAHPRRGHRGEEDRIPRRVVRRHANGFVKDTWRASRASRPRAVATAGPSPGCPVAGGRPARRRCRPEHGRSQCEIAAPRVPEVPWIAIRSPPSQPEGRRVWRAVSATAQQP